MSQDQVHAYIYIYIYIYEYAHERIIGVCRWAAKNSPTTTYYLCQQCTHKLYRPGADIAHCIFFNVSKASEVRE